MDLDRAPCLYYDLWTVVLECIPRREWLPLANVTPSLDDVVIYFARERHMMARDLFGDRPTTIESIVTAVRWGQTIFPPTGDVLDGVCQRLIDYTSDHPPTLPLNLELSDVRHRFMADVLGVIKRADHRIGDLRLTRMIHETATSCMASLNTVSSFRSLQKLFVRHCSEMNDDIVLTLARNCPNLWSLALPGCENVHDVNPLQQLTELIIFGDDTNAATYGDEKAVCGVGQSGIERLVNLRALDVGYNTTVSDVTMFPNLEELGVFGCCGVAQDGIAGLKKLRILIACHNTEIRDLNEFQALEEIDICWGCGVTQEGIAQLRNLRVLKATDNRNIVDVNMCPNIEVLEIGGDCGVTQRGISGLRKVKKLDAGINSKVFDLSHLPLLERLDIRWGCGVGQEGISKLTNVKELIATDNERVKSVNHLRKLESLSIAGESAVGQPGILGLKNIRKLVLGYNNCITNVSMFPLLEVVDVGFGCGLTSEALDRLRQLGVRIEDCNDQK